MSPTPGLVVVDSSAVVALPREWVTCYDASYVALAELLDAPLVTLDRRVARAHGPRCAFLTPPEAPEPQTG